MTELVQGWLNKAIDLGVVKAEDAEIYAYGLRELLYSLFTWLIFFIASFFAGVAGYMILFTLMYIPLRIYAGGIHFATRFRCFCFSVIMIGTIFALPFLSITTFLAKAVMIALPATLLTIYMLAPVEDSRKPINTLEKRHYHNVAFSICIGEVILAVLFYIFGSWAAVYYIGSAGSMVSFQLLCGKIKNQIISVCK